MAFSSSFIFQVIFACNGQLQCDTTIYQSYDSAFTSSNTKLHQMLFLSLYGNDNRLSYRSIYILLLKLFHNSVNTTYISYILVTQQVLQVRSSLPFYFYRIQFSFSFITRSVSFLFSPPPTPLPPFSFHAILFVIACLCTLNIYNTIR